MTLTEIIDKAVQDGKGVEQSLELFNWEDEGQSLKGRLLSYEDFTGGDFDTVCQRYTFETDEGKVSTVLGTVGDRALKSPENKGRLFCIQFRGKKEGKKGTKFNDFSILLIPEMGHKK